MSFKRLALWIAVTITGISWIGAAYAAEGEGAEDESYYAKQGSFELGGSIANLTWTDNAFSAIVSPSFGYFIRDALELSLLVSYSYDREDDDVEGRTITRRGAFLFEPSYHPGIAHRILALVGLGIGAGYDGDDFDFELAPRVGLNFEVGNSAVITPAVKMPIFFNPDGTTVGFTVEVGVSAAW